ncbi:MULTISPECIES: hypothetical protein [unclassified Mesorhizobium]|uniref:hypothetical protein n=1 Tax=unclassified Mesorhizobium TaxID=325217 RepID=UPI001CCE013A|nr:MULTISPECIES: hypothetical protein [unclassified Mesorhizobium]MBZ9769239.1 hypothetical protein [Mesorhizobium sp. CA6]MBZ9914579.1 hypothetical protein [Mesorhizobium sp. CA16]
MLHDVDYVLRKLDWLRAEGIWPNGLRYLWTDAFGVVLYVSLYTETGEERWLGAADRLVADVERVLGRRRGLRIGEAADRDGQYFHYLAMWLFALARLGDLKPEYRKRGIALARDIHPAFVIPGRGVIWKMQEDLSSPYPGYGLGSMDAYDGYVSYRMLGEDALAVEIAQMRDLMERDWRTLDIEQDLGLGMMLWLAHFFPDEPWAEAQTRRSLRTLETMWVDPPGYFSRAPWLGDTKFAFTNYGVSLGLQAAGIWPGRIDRLNAFFEDWRSGDEYDREAITWVMACTSHLPGAFLARGGEGSTESDGPRERSSADPVVDGSASRRKGHG